MSCILHQPPGRSEIGGGSVINDNQLETGFLLAQDTVNGSQKTTRSVERWNDDGDEERLFHSMGKGERA